MAKRGRPLKAPDKLVFLLFAVAVGAVRIAGSEEATVRSSLPAGALQEPARTTAAA